MRVDVHFGAPTHVPGDVTGRVVAVIDVLRASTVIATALDHGARAVIPLGSPDEVVMRAKSFAREAVLLAGERRSRPIPGFDLGNSPGEFTRKRVKGRTVIMTTTNGTAALLAISGARDVVIASYVNFTAVLTMLRTALRGGTDVSLVCAGNERQFSLEDAACAGRYVHHLLEGRTEAQPNDAAQAAALLHDQFGDDLARLFDTAVHGKALTAAGFADDLVECANIDAHPVIPVYQDRQITKLGPERER